MISRSTFICATSAAIAFAFATAAQTPVPGQMNHSTREIDTSMNHPVEPRIADKGGLTVGARTMPFELAEPQGFDRVYEVPGKIGMFYRGSGGLYLVFDEGEYKRGKKGPVYATVPPGAVFYIGKPDWSRIKQQSIVAAGSISSQQEIRQSSVLGANEIAKASKQESEIQPVDAVKDAKRDLSRGSGLGGSGAGSDADSGSNADSLKASSAQSAHAPLGKSLALVLGNQVGFGGGSARPDSATESIPDPSTGEFASKAPDAAAWAGTLPAGVDRSFLVGTGNTALPRIVADFIYRQERLDTLFLRATHSSRQ